MPVSSGWLPISSALERSKERYLREEGRCFWKPLSVDAKVLRTLPDFRLEEDRGQKM
jgi:hypothetical protein